MTLEDFIDRERQAAERMEPSPGTAVALLLDRLADTINNGNIAISIFIKISDGKATISSISTDQPAAKAIEQTMTETAEHIIAMMDSMLVLAGNVRDSAKACPSAV